jgi:hypothetical protein
LPGKWIGFVDVTVPGKTENRKPGPVGAVRLVPRAVLAVNSGESRELRGRLGHLYRVSLRLLFEEADMLATLLVLLTLGAEPVEAPDTLVVCPAELAPALQPWLAHRAAQGHRIALLRNFESAAAIRAAIRETAKAGRLRYVLLVGDADPAAAVDETVRARSVPTHLAKAKVNVRWGSEPEIATDNWYADLDDDGVPDLAVGRLTADNKEELSLMVRKILDYERTAGSGLWRRQVNCIAGVGGFGPLVDSVLEMATKKFLTEGVPSSYVTTMTYGSWRSPYCPDPRMFHRTTVERLNEGCLFWVYIGHGQKTYLDRVYVPGGVHHILDTNDMPKLQCAHGAPIALFLACYTGAFDQPRDCLAEEMLRTEGGPVAVLSGSRVTMPYAMSVMAGEMLDEYFHKQRETLGDVVLGAKRRMVANDPQNTNRRLLDAIAAAVSPAPELLAEERAEHLLLFNLLGDPLLRLQHPRDVRVDVAESIDAGQTLEISGVSPTAGRCTVELVCRRDRLKFAAPLREQFRDSDDALVQFSEVYQQANDQSWAALAIDVEAGPFRTRLQVPAEARGPCHVRVYVEGNGNFAIGAADVFIRRPSTSNVGK